ncbi:type II toxin-antitoxin system Phd/YefM family antitoxin [Leucobacter massiliensis]|uniref:Antitoxin n=1 Tax=Leucobacter massiliensis TaxID=1686285 RepID=A0A2S9QN53_9MICO|nr:type II toxin-antitoxin system prevent-host-death family antitoxin [Leucobacter massiliensis]PRI11009.1 antitoxin [Leucobacter massiliensis]
MNGGMVNVYEAKTQLSKLLDLAAQGTETVIAKSGKPVAKLVPWQPETPRTPGVWAGRVRIGADFDAHTEQDERDWYGEP